ncbi:hypothetical protein [Paenibacillus kobensis]|uniref:hypothetical protein n=1 Tax=Paenibacillus kobensis TaxID=59841 RepID=UPI000FDB2AFE|nr:hypothetical protein [Paenibacillus kobensis]
MKKRKELSVFSEVIQRDIITDLKLPDHASKADIEFWTSDYDNIENNLLLHEPTIRNRIGYDLTYGTGFAFVADDIVIGMKREGFVAYDSEFYQMYDSHYMQAISTLWSWLNSSDPPTEQKRKRCYAFSSALHNGLNGGEKDGYGYKLHKEASIALDKLMKSEGPASPYRSLQIFYALFNFCFDLR